MNFAKRFYYYHPEWIWDGLAFSGTLLSILLAHEMGHYLLSRHHQVEATLPYFLPAPNLVGTFGAVIMMRSKIKDRRALVDIGAAGPIAGFIVSLVAMIVGFQEARLVPHNPYIDVVSFHPNAIMSLGMRLSLDLQTIMAFKTNMALSSPILDAACIGFFVTMLNLLPIGQLDGGHISYAVLGKRSVYVSWVMVIVLIVLGLLVWPTWLFFALLLLIVMGRQRFKHPEPKDLERGLGPFRYAVALFCLFIFLVSFSIVPISISDAINFY